MSIVFGLTSAALGQLEPDETLGEERSQVREISPVDFDIEGGARRGNNLFHSFREFNVNEGGSVYFVNPDGIQNILSRVTGGNPSNILGRLGVFGNANLFLINPNGIVFGPNASLDVGGSFAATTADGIQFGEQGFFSATNPETPGLLTVNPSALFFNQLNPAPIRNNSIAPAGQNPAGLGVVGLRVPDGQSLLLVGGNIILDGEDFGGRLNAFGGRVELGGLSEPGAVLLNADGSLGFPVGVGRSDVSLSNGAFINVVAGDGGSIAIYAQNIDISDGSVLRAGIFPGLGTVNSQSGAIMLNATEAIRIAASIITNPVGSNATGNSGNIRITTGSLSLTDGASLTTSTVGQGNAGNVIIDAQDWVSLDGAFAASTVGDVNPDTVAIGEGGDIRITTGSLSLTNGAQLISGTNGQGNAGNVVIDAEGRVLFDSTSANGTASAAFSNVAVRGEGNGGNIEITAGSLEVLNGAGLVASTIGQGNAGNVVINAEGRVLFDGTSANGQFTSAAFSSVESDAVGNAGNVVINADSLEVINGAQLVVYSLERGNAGNVVINAEGRVLFGGTSADGDGSAASSRVAENAIGNGGNVVIDAGSLEVINGARLSASTNGRGNAGRVIISATDRVIFRGTGTIALSTVEQRGNGRGGNVEITAPILEVLNGARLSASTRGQGNAGSVIISATDRVTFRGISTNGLVSAALSTVERTGNGSGGNIEISTAILEVLNGAALTASTDGRGNAGNVFITATDRATLDGTNANDSQLVSGIFSRVGENGIRRGGNIRIDTDILEVLNGAQLLANARGQGRAGNIRIDANDRVLIDGVGSGGLSSGLFTSTGANATGRGGRVTVTTPELRIANGAVINAQTANNRPGGSVVIEAEQFTALNGGQVITTALSGGQAGNITLNADRIVISGIDPNYRQRIRQNRQGVTNQGDRSGLFANTRSNSTGNGGRITVNSNNLTLENGATISAQSQGTGTAGDIRLNVSEQLQLTDSDIVTNAPRLSGGDITVNTDESSGLILLRGDSDITTNSQGNGGNITLQGSGIIAFDDSDILARSQDARGGNITLAPFFSANPTLESEPPFDGNGRVDVNADGSIASGTITTPDTSLIQNSLIDLPESAIDTDNLVANSCVVRSQEQSGTFIITGAEGLPQRPGDAPLPTYPTGEVRSAEESSSESTWQMGDPIVEPQGMYRLQNGRMVLSRECD